MDLSQNRGASMPEISISRKHGLNESDVRSRIEALADKISDRLGGSWNWQGDQAVCLAHGARAQVGYDAESISIEVSLPPMMRPLRGRLEAKIIEYFDRSFADPSL
jgi:putative polyhydroxyalkanoate system protein